MFLASKSQQVTWGTRMFHVNFISNLIYLFRSPMQQKTRFTINKQRTVTLLGLDDSHVSYLQIQALLQKTCFQAQTGNTVGASSHLLFIHSTDYVKSPPGARQLFWAIGTRAMNKTKLSMNKIWQHQLEIECVIEHQRGSCLCSKSLSRVLSL